MKKLFLFKEEIMQIYGDNHGKSESLRNIDLKKFAFQQIVMNDDNFYMKIKFAIPLDKVELVDSANYDHKDSLDEGLIFMLDYADETFEEKKKEKIQELIDKAKSEIIEPF